MYFVVMLRLARSQRVQRAPRDNKGIYIAYNDGVRKWLLSYQLLHMFNHSVPVEWHNWNSQFLYQYQGDQQNVIELVWFTDQMIMIKTNIQEIFEIFTVD